MQAESALLAPRPQVPRTDQVIDRWDKREQRQQREQLSVVVALSVGRRDKPPATKGQCGKHGADDEEPDATASFVCRLLVMAT